VGRYGGLGRRLETIGPGKITELLTLGRI